MPSYRNVKTAMGSALVFLVMFLVMAPCVIAEQYRLTTTVSFVYCMQGTGYCEMNQQLGISQGATVYFNIVYEPDAYICGDEIAFPWGERIICEWSEPRVRLSTPTVANAEVMIAPLTSYPSYVTIYDHNGSSTAPYDNLRWSALLGSAPCPSVAPCLRAQSATHSIDFTFGQTDDDHLSPLDAHVLPPDLTARPAECLGHACGYAHQEQIFVTDWIAFYTLICTVDVIERWEAPEQLSALVDSVMELNVKSGIANSLDDKLASALEAVDDVNEQNDVSACNRTQAFINTVEAQRGTQITDVDADALIAAAQEIIEALSCQ